MITIPVASLKAAVPFKAGALPRINPAAPEFVLDLGGVKIPVVITAKAARKLAEHQGGAVLQGKLVSQNGQLYLVESGFQFLEKPVEAST